MSKWQYTSSRRGERGSKWLPQVSQIQIARQHSFRDTTPKAQKMKAFSPKLSRQRRPPVGVVVKVWKAIELRIFI